MSFKRSELCELCKEQLSKLLTFETKVQSKFPLRYLEFQLWSQKKKSLRRKMYSPLSDDNDS